MRRRNTLARQQCMCARVSLTDERLPTEREVRAATVIYPNAPVIKAPGPTLNAG